MFLTLISNKWQWIKNCRIYGSTNINFSLNKSPLLFIKKTVNNVSGVYFSLENNPQDKIHVYSQDYDSETISDDYTPTLYGKTEYILHKIHNSQNDNFVLKNFKYASNEKYKIISIVIYNLTSGTSKFKIAGTEPRSSIQILDQSITIIVRATENIPTIICVKIMKTSHHGLSFIFFISSRIEHLKLVIEDNLSYGKVLLLNKVELIPFPNFGSNNLISYCAITYSSKNEKVKLNWVFNEYQTLYFANKEERTNNRS